MPVNGAVPFNPPNPTGPGDMSGSVRPRWRYPVMSQWRGQVWRWYLAASLASAGAYFLLPRAGLGQAIVYSCATLACSLALVAGARLHRPRRAVAWYVLALGMVLYSAADIVWFTKPPFPSAADALFLSAYALLGVGFVMLVRQRSAGRYRESVIDALIIASGAGVLAWVFLMEPYVYLSGLSTLARVISMAYPAMDVVLLAALVTLVFSRGSRRIVLGFLAVGIVGQLCADVGYALDLLDGNFRFGAPYFGGWFAVFAFVGAGALHPSMATLNEPAQGASEETHRWRLLVLSAAAMVPPATLVARALGGGADTGTVVGVAALSSLLFALVLVRVGGLMSELTEYRRLQALKDEFVSIVSHELRTPLTSIRGSLGLLAGGALTATPEKAKRMLQIALENTDRLVRLINDILDIERMESGKVELQRRPCDGGRLVREAAETMATAATQAGVRLELGEGGGHLWADPDRVLQTLTNLLSNAIKFSPPGSRVWVGCETSGGEVIFGVRDEGRGVPSDQLEQIFERFQQVDSSDAREKGGTGLGLAICRSIVEQHGGRIWAESGAGKGSVFQFTLPAAAGRPGLAGAREPAALGASSPPPPRILICDDDAAVREVLGAMLEQRGYGVIGAASGREAIERAASEHPSAILLDILMPGMSGWDTALALSQAPETQAIPVIILSVLAAGENVPERIAVTDWIEKPLDEMTLFGALERALVGQAAITRILVVEDDLDLASVLMALFERHGLQVAHAASGAQAVELSRKLQPDLLILDIGLPDGDGFWVADWLRQHERLRSVPIVVYTARELDPTERERLDTGNTHFMTKGAVTLEQFEREVLNFVGAVVPVADAVGNGA